MTALDFWRPVEKRMGKKLADMNASIRNGNVLVVSCQGSHGGKGPCGGYLRLPFTPGLNSAPGAQPNSKGFVWKKVRGESLDDLTLEPSFDAGECGHFFVTDGEIR